ncbi:hypothetical protein WJX72_011418 [[Myrmecia] bisecta]|uniref:TLC domain-containing protein n=1 Tax=[Myrmecia] bisecta TaxID=41462 RepID=A0AAW1QAA4_9CHLO
MGTAEFPVAKIHQIAALSCLAWVIVNIAAHLLSSWLWKGYKSLSTSNKLGWCNRIASAIHAIVLVSNQAWNLADPQLTADPLFAVSDGHFRWGSVMYGYLIYDTLYTLVFYKAVGSPSFILHHALGLVCCCFGLYFNKLALFGIAIEVFFEGTTPLLHLLGCMKVAGLEDTVAFLVAGLAFAAQFFVFRVVIAQYYWYLMIKSVLALEHRPAWGWAGIAVYGALSALNVFWFSKLVRMAVTTCTTPRASVQSRKRTSAFAREREENLLHGSYLKQVAQQGPKSFPLQHLQSMTSECSADLAAHAMAAGVSATVSVGSHKKMS